MRPALRECARCGKTKEARRGEFYLRTRIKRGGIRRVEARVCAECGRKSRAEYRRSNPDKVRASLKAWSIKNSEWKKKYMQEYAQKNKDRLRINAARRANRRLKEDLWFRIKTCMSARVRDALKRKGVKKDTTSESLVGCSAWELKEYIESKFQPGMSWDNWSRNGWHIDHILPLASFDLAVEEQRKQAFHYTNLQPLWARDNMEKKARLDWVPRACLLQVG